MELLENVETGLHEIVGRWWDAVNEQPPNLRMWLDEGGGEGRDLHLAAGTYRQLGYVETLDLEDRHAKWRLLEVLDGAGGANYYLAEGWAFEDLDSIDYDIVSDCYRESFLADLAREEDSATRDLHVGQASLLTPEEATRWLRSYERPVPAHLEPVETAPKTGLWEDAPVRPALERDDVTAVELRHEPDYARIADGVDTHIPNTAEQQGWSLQGLVASEERAFLIARGAIESEARHGGFTLLRTGDCRLPDDLGEAYRSLGTALLAARATRSRLSVFAGDRTVYHALDSIRAEATSRYEALVNSMRDELHRVGVGRVEWGGRNGFSHAVILLRSWQPGMTASTAPSSASPTAWRWSCDTTSGRSSNSTITGSRPTHSRWSRPNSDAWRRGARRGATPPRLRLCRQSKSRGVSASSWQSERPRCRKAARRLHRSMNSGRSGRGWSRTASWRRSVRLWMRSTLRVTRIPTPYGS